MGLDLAQLLLTLGCVENTEGHHRGNNRTAGLD